MFILAATCAVMKISRVDSASSWDKEHSPPLKLTTCGSSGPYRSRVLRLVAIVSETHFLVGHDRDIGGADSEDLTSEKTPPYAVVDSRVTPGGESASAQCRHDRHVA